MIPIMSRKPICTSLIVIVTLGFFTAQPLTASGPGSAPRLDPSFGVGGLVTTDWPLGDVARLSALLVLPDGKIVLGGINPSGARLVRYLGDGSPDPSFATGGVLTFSFDGSSGDAAALALQTDGKLLVGGFFVPSASTAWRYVARFNEDGSLDLAFGAGGYVAFGQPGPDESIDSLALQPDGKILVGGSVPGGFLLGRLEEDGSVDAAFGDSGRVTTPFPGGIYPSVSSIHLQPDGKIVVGGSYYHQVLARYEPDGTLDLSFGNGGVVDANLFDDTRSIGWQPDGKTLVQGVGSGKSGAVMMVARFDANGVLDATYGRQGVGSAGFDPLFGVATVSAVHPDGRLVAVGEAASRQSLSDSTVALTGLLPNGNPDHGYQKDTGMILPFIGTQFTGVAVQINGRIVAAGYGRQQGQTDQTYHWFMVRFIPKQSRLVPQEPL